MRIYFFQNKYQHSAWSCTKVESKHAQEFLSFHFALKSEKKLFITDKLVITVNVRLSLSILSLKFAHRLVLWFIIPLPDGAKFPPLWRYLQVHRVISFSVCEMQCYWILNNCASKLFQPPSFRICRPFQGVLFPPPGIGPVSKAESDCETDLDQCACLKTYMSWIFNSLVTDVRSVVSGRPGLAHRAVQSWIWERDLDQCGAVCCTNTHE